MNRTSCHELGIAQVSEPIPHQTVQTIGARPMEGIDGGTLSSSLLKISLSVWVVLQCGNHRPRLELVVAVGGLF